MAKRTPRLPPPAETSGQLRARLRAFALATPEEAMTRRTVPFPARVTVLAGPLRRRPGRPGSPVDEPGNEPGNEPAGEPDAS